jgi:lipopolysaccharide assembly outer membrane protein LptD (OstA)
VKTILLVGAVLGVTMIGSAQTAQAPEGRVLAATQEIVDESLTYLRGGVEIQIGGIRVTADEVDFHGDTGVYDLRGNVHLLTRPR